ncbi:unnamed protein product, partial [marine sediment metagenome]
AALLDNLIGYTAVRAESLTNLGRALEGYTPTVGIVANNMGTYVTVLDITGRGMLTAFGSNTFRAADSGVEVKLTLDAGVVMDTRLFERVADIESYEVVRFLLAFDTSCLLEMKMSDAVATTGDFLGVAMVE